MRFKRSAFIFLFACAVLLTSCSNGASYDESFVTETSPVISETSESGGLTVSSSETPEETSITSAASAETKTDIPAVSAEDTAETSAESRETSSSVTQEETETAAASSDVTQAVTTASASAIEITAPEKPPEKVVIPEIKMPDSPGTQTASENNAEIDYSNASEGYISAVYNGPSKAAKVRIECDGVQYNHDLSTGGKREYFPLMGSGAYKVSVYEQFSGKKYALLVSAEFSAVLTSPTGMYLYPNKYVDFNAGSDCVRKAAELCAGASGDVERIAAIFTYITDNVTYDKQLAATVQSGYVPDPDSTLSSGKGICYDYASLFAAMCRSQGIPARLVTGYAEPDIYHAWNEVYTDETGWITPELFLKNKGYNIADATFYAGNSDKEKISEYIADSSNYSAIYRY